MNGPFYHSRSRSECTRIALRYENLNFPGEACPQTPLDLWWAYVAYPATAMYWFDYHSQLPYSKSSSYATAKLKETLDLINFNLYNIMHAHWDYLTLCISHIDSDGHQYCHHTHSLQYLLHRHLEQKSTNQMPLVDLILWQDTIS